MKANYLILLNVRGLVDLITSPRRNSNEPSLEQRRGLGILVESNKRISEK